MTSPFSLEDDAQDSGLALRAAEGDRDALSRLLRAHQRWVFAIALRMVKDSDYAADLTQEALLRVVTRIAQFEGRSSFRTWAYRIVVRCMLDAKRSRSEQMFAGFAEFGAALEQLPLGDPPPDLALLAEETKISCMMGMLLCLDRDQRIAYILGAILGASSDLAAEILETTPAAFRKRLERARADLDAFMQDKCGLMNAENPCRCPKKTAAAVRAGWVDPGRLRFTGARLRTIAREAPHLAVRSAELEDAGAALFRDHPLHEGPDMAEALERMLADPDTTRVFRLT